ncbi:MAG: helicase [Planctomycetes bacterium]|nr:helicase [Planctomycetota bacterium]
MACPDALAAAPPRGAGQPAAAVLSAGVREAIRREVAQAGGAEVVFFGRVDRDGRVVEVEVAARGNMGAAPALVSRADGHDVALHNHPGGVLLPSDADLAVAVALAERGVGTMIVSDDAERVHVVVPPRRPTSDPVDPEEVARLLGPGGPVARALGGGFEARQGQVDMARRVAGAFAGEQVALLEAGTGTGKTFAYLVPAALHALRNRERVVVSTATIHLQEQVSRKDVPLVRRALEGQEARGGRPLPRLEAVVLKGRGNYVSLRRAEEAAGQDPGLFGSDQERVEVERLARWARESATGDKGELTPPPSADAWEHVESQADNCLRARCPRFDACHYFESRRAAARAQLVIVNHHLLFSDLAAKETLGTWDAAVVLPPFRRAILDEGHHVEHVAGEHFGQSASEHAVGRALGRLLRRSGRKGVLPGLGASLARVRGDAAARLAREVDEELLPLREAAGLEAEAAFAQVAAAVRAALPPAERQSKEARLRLGPAHALLLRPLLEAARGLAALGARVARLVESAEHALGEEPAPAANAAAAGVGALLREAAAAGRRLTRAAEALETFGGDLAAHDPVRWAEVDRDRRGADRLTLRAVPLDTGPLVRRALLEPMRTVVLASATLTVEGRFDFLGRGLGLPGLEGRAVTAARIASPFDYGRQALLAVPADVPLPDRPEFGDAVAHALLAAARLSRGRMFALFTSYGALTRAHRALEGPLRREGLVPLRQGEGGRAQLLERFRATPGAVLFGTDSFWEGVDVPGDRLVLVAITRLPFRVPSEPLQEARAEAVARRGGDPFHELQLPQAALKLTQGFGRLIRTATDRGAVLVLDRRLVARGYGRRFLESLPPVRVAVEPLPRLLETLRPFVVRA